MVDEGDWQECKGKSREHLGHDFARCGDADAGVKQRDKQDVCAEKTHDGLGDIADRPGNSSGLMPSCASQKKVSLKPSNVPVPSSVSAKIASERGGVLLAAMRQPGKPNFIGVLARKGRDFAKEREENCEEFAAFQPCRAKDYHHQKRENPIQAAKDRKLDWIGRGGVRNAVSVKGEAAE